MIIQRFHFLEMSSGIVEDAFVNCDNATDIGQKAASEMSGKKLTDITLCRNDKVKTTGAKEKMVKVRGQHIDVNATLLFTRITCVLSNSSEMRSFVAYELAPHPPSLFQDGVMRKPAKSSLGLVLKSFT